jgi:hypothetical protein
MALSLSNDWRYQLKGQMQRVNASMRQLSNGAHKFPFIAALLDDYNKAAAVAMGSVSARGGYPLIDFHGFDGDPDRWKALSPWTVAFKVGVDIDPDGGGMTQEALKSVWDGYADSTYIWQYEGGAQAALTTNPQRGVAGILGGEALSYAKKVEEGGEWDYGKVPARPLFAALNRAFREYLHEQLSNRYSPLYLEIQREVRKAGLWQYGKL